MGPVRIYYQVAGAGEPLILIHGLSGSGRWWGRNVGALASRFRVYVIDLIGFGGSRGRHPFVLSEAAVRLSGWMERLDLSRAGFIGHSMGGFIALDLASRYPERVTRLMLVDAAVLPAARGTLRSATDLLRTLRRLPPSFMPVLVADALRAGPVTIARATRELMTTDLRADLAGLDIPTCIVWGEHDHVVPVDVGRDLARRIPGAKLIVINRAGHNPMWDRSAEFNQIAIDFMTGSGDGRGQ